MGRYKKFNYDEHARSCGKKELHKQILRTCNGKPISDEQEQIIVRVIQDSLLIKPEDFILDLACGNASLSQHFFTNCTELLGVDISGYLIEVAKDNFGKEEKVTFVNASVSEYLFTETLPKRFTKAMCFGSFQYISDAESKEMLYLLNTKFTRVSRVMLGNIPDFKRLKNFYKDRLPSKQELEDHQTAIGKWRSKEQVRKMAEKCNWHCEFTNMPDDFYAANYRFNAILTRKVRSDG